MISPVEAALTRVVRRIPSVVLRAVFPSHRNFEFYIREEVLFPIVKRDLSIHGGKLEDIGLHPNWVESPPGTDYSIIRIPPAAIANRRIADVMEVVFKSPGGDTGLQPAVFAGFRSNTQLMDAAADSHRLKLFGNDQYLPKRYTVNARQNVITVTPQLQDLYGAHLRVRLEYDNEFTNMATVNIEPFIAVVVLATKMYIWDQLISRGVKSSDELYNLIADWSPETKDAEYIEALKAFATSMNFDQDMSLALLSAQYG